MRLCGYEPTVGASDDPQRSVTCTEAIAVNRSRIIAIARMAAMWIPAILLLFIFVPQGWAKFSDTSGWATAFRVWNYPDWFRVTIGVIELSAALLLLWGRTALIGAGLIICVMLGAMGTHIVKEGGRHITSEVVPITLATIVFVLRLRAARRPLAPA